MKRAIASLSVILMMTVSTVAFAQDAAPTSDAAATTTVTTTTTTVATPAADAPYEVLRAGDRDMSCADIAYETNKLNAFLLANQNAQVTKAKNAKATSGLMRSAGRFGLSRLPGIGGMGAKALDAANNVAADAVADNGMPTGITTPQQQRMNRLLVIFKEKAC